MKHRGRVDNWHSVPLSQFLLSAKWMQSLPLDKRERVLADAYETFHDEQETVARQGDTVDSWMGVVSGLLKVSATYSNGKSVLFSGIPQGSWVGEGSVLKPELRHYDLVALRPSRVVHIPRSTFQWLLAVSYDFNRFVIDHLNERLAQFMAMVETDRMTDPVARLCRAIVGLYNPVLYPNMSRVLDMSQEELGDLAGLTRQRTNIAIKVLFEAGLVHSQYGSIVLHDIAGLRLRSTKTESDGAA